MVLTTPQVNLYSSDVERTAAFYAHLGFVESFRTPDARSGRPRRVQARGLTLGVGSAAAGIRDHGLDIRLTSAAGGRGRALDA